ncbi:MAG: ATP-binding protein [Myxococcota bacterium]
MTQQQQPGRMLEFHDIKLFVYGSAAVVDTAVMLVLLERRNWPRVMLPLMLLVTGVWIYHAGAFAHIVLVDAVGPVADTAQWLAMMLMAAGLGLQPSAALHGWWRLGHAGFEPQPKADRRGMVFYLPLLALVAVGVLLAEDPRAPFLHLLAPLVAPYLVWLMVANTVAGFGSLILARRFSERAESSFLRILGVALVALAGLEGGVVLLAVGVWPEWRDVLIAMATVCPVILTLVLAYVILRFQFMELVLRRSIIYATLVVGVVLLHRVVLVDIWTDLSARYQLDFVLLEGALIVALILVYRPLRLRAAEALHYLMGESITETRSKARALALDMAAKFDEPAERVLEWFRRAAADMLRVDDVAIWLFDNGDRIGVRSGPTERLTDEQARSMVAALVERELSACQLADAPTREVARAMGCARASFAVALRHPTIRGLILFGARHRRRELAGEQIAAVVMLVEQLGITLNNGVLQAERSAAERRALQNEKLSTLGLVAGSIAHEVKNPLSSIKTIASVMAEDVPPDSEQHKDLQIIVDEVDRLSESVSAILTFARPAAADGRRASASEAIEGTLRIMRHLAKQHGVELSVSVAADLPTMDVDENAVREVVFNLLANAIDAAGVGGRVAIDGATEAGRVVIRVHDSGPGIPPAIQDRIYEPFVTGREEGTGLGLYVVSRRLRDVGGEIHCESSTDRGTVFTVKLPVSDA